MAYITLDETLPGMRSLLAYRPALAPSLTGLMQVMMRSDQGLKKGERELIASFVSGLNHCTICENIHSVVACNLLDLKVSELDHIKQYFYDSKSDRLKALLTIAEKIQQSGQQVISKQIELAKNIGCTDQEIHDTVLIAALFCMFNRYIDGLGIQTSDTPETLSERGHHIALNGYTD